MMIMGTQFTPKDKTKIQKGIQKKYKKVSRSPEGLFKYPIGMAGLKALNYDSALIDGLSETVKATYCGVGNPFIMGPLNRGESILDIGCGAGVDTILAAEMTGPSGSVVGIDVISEMLERAKNNVSTTVLENISFQQASAEKLPFDNQHFDVVISNGVFNLVPFKIKALTEVYRVLKPAGRLMIADNVLIGDLPGDKKQIIKSWSQ
jgi:SAM-dependent methyltransferase